MKKKMYMMLDFLHPSFIWCRQYGKGRFSGYTWGPIVTYNMIVEKKDLMATSHIVPSVTKQCSLSHLYVLCSRWLKIVQMSAWREKMLTL